MGANGVFLSENTAKSFIAWHSQTSKRPAEQMNRFVIVCNHLTIMKISPSEDLEIDMIMNFPSSDPLHLLELGIMRKCIYRWVFGEQKYSGKCKKLLVDLTSRLLATVQTEMPNDIHRAVRKLDSLRHWKGLEYRTMLLYVGCVIFEQVI